VWWDLGPHLADQALQLFGLPERVIASLSVQRAGAAVADWAHVVFEYAQRRVVLHASMLVAGGSPRFIVHGTRGSLIKPRADQQEAQLLAGIVPGAVGWGEDDDALLWHDEQGVISRVPTPPGDQRRYYMAVRDAVRGHGASPVTPAQAVALMAVLEAAVESATQGKAVMPALTAQERAAFDPS
jgi:predicted dehydrogenase